MEESMVPNVKPDMAIVERYISTGMVEICTNLQPVIDQVNQASDEILGCAEGSKLGEVLDILGEMNGQLKKLDTSNAGLLAPIKTWFTGTKRGVQRTILERKQIKTILEEKKAAYELKKEGLEKNIEKVENLIKASENASMALEKQIKDLVTAKQAIQEAIKIWDPIIDEKRIQAAEQAVQRYSKLINDAHGIKYLHDTTVVGSATQLAERETLYGVMIMLGPQLEVLLKQQLAILISQLEVRAGVEEVSALRDGINKIAVANMRAIHEDAKAVAEISNSPIVSEETVNLMTAEIIGMITDVRQVVEKSLEQGDKVVQAVTKGRKDIQKAFKQLKLN